MVQLARFLDAMSAMNGTDAVDSFSGIVSADYLVVGSTSEACAAPGHGGFGGPPDPPPKVTCDADGCHLSYIISMSYPWFEAIDGTVGVNGAFDVSYSRSHGPSYTYGFSLTGTIADRIDGTLTLDSHSDSNSHGTILVRYEDVSLANGCPVRGTLHVHDVLDAGSSGGQNGHDFENTVSAWPPCP